MGSLVSKKQDLLNEWLALEDIFAANNYNPNNDDEVIYIEGSSSRPIVMFCAPHALNHYRNNKLKIADIFTGSLCQILAKQSNQPGLISTLPTKNSKHLGFGKDYLDHVKDKTKKGAMIVDIHGMSDSHGFDICIGTGPNPSTRIKDLAINLANTLPEYKVSINHPFDGSPDYTMTNFVQNNLKGDSIQIEISSRLRRPDRNSNDSSIFLHKINNLIKEHLN